jgi:hypothetical protein
MEHIGEDELHGLYSWVRDSRHAVSRCVLSSVSPAAAAFCI